MRKNNKNTTILSESTIRRFMKLANIEPLTENYFGQFAEAEEEEAPPVEDDMGGGEDMGDEEMPPMDDMGGEDEGPEAGMTLDVDPAVVKDIVDAIASAVSKATGVEVTASSDSEGEMGGEDDMAGLEDELGGEDELEGGEELEGEDEMGDEGEDEEEEGPATRYERLIMKRVAKRVAERLMAEATASRKRVTPPARKLNTKTSVQNRNKSVRSRR